MRHTSVVKHSIPTTASPIRQPLRRILQALKSAVSNEVHRMLDHNIIRPSNSPWSSPVVMIRKKDGSWCSCIDYRKLNAVTCHDAYPLAGLVGEECLIYLDDIIVFSSSFEEHLLRLTRILQALRGAGLQLKPSKCHFAHQEV